MSNKTRKYFFYAIGEILLVVIGILIALQVNNWNKNRIERNLENRYLQRLLIDLDNDLHNISTSIQSNIYRKERAEFLLSATDSSDLIEDDPTYFVQSIEYAGYTNEPVISDHTFEEIKSSGNLSILRNEEIRTALSAYYSNVSNRGQYDFIRQDYQLQYLRNQQGILTKDQQIDMGSFQTSENYTLDDAKGVYDRMMNKPEFIEWLPYVVQTKVRTDESLQGFHEQALELKDLILIDLENN